MRRVEIIESINDINRAIEDSGVLKAFRAVAKKSRLSQDINSDGLNMVMESLISYIGFSEKYDDNSNKVIKILKLDFLQDAQFWSSVFDSDQVSLNLYKANAKLNFAIDSIPKFIALITQEDVEKIKTILDMEGEEKENDILTIILMEEKSQYSHPKRIIDVLKGIEALYESFSVIIRGEISEMSVIAFDSGSDKAIDLLGVAKVVSSIKDLVIEMWDNVVYYQELKAGERVKLVTSNLSIIDQIGELEKDGKLEQGQAESLKRNIISGIEWLLSAGAIIPEIHGRAYSNPRKLMAPDPKLIAAVSESEEQVDDLELVEAGEKGDEEISTQLPSQLDISNLNEEDLARLTELLSKVQDKAVKRATGEEKSKKKSKKKKKG